MENNIMFMGQKTQYCNDTVSQTDLQSNPNKKSQVYHRNIPVGSKIYIEIQRPMNT